MPEPAWLASFAAAVIEAVYAGRLPDESIQKPVLYTAGPSVPHEPLIDVLAQLFADRSGLDVRPGVCYDHPRPLWEAHTWLFDERPGLVDLAARTVGVSPPTLDLKGVYAQLATTTAPPRPGHFSWKGVMDSDLPAVRQQLTDLLADCGELACGSGLAWEPSTNSNLPLLRTPGGWRLSGKLAVPDRFCGRPARWAVTAEPARPMDTDNAFLCEPCLRSEQDWWHVWGRFHPTLRRWCDSYFGVAYPPRAARR